MKKITRQIVFFVTLFTILFVLSFLMGVLWAAKYQKDPENIHPINTAKNDLSIPPITSKNDSILLPKTEKNVIDTQIGIACYYDDEFHGQRTANGEIFDQNKLTAAHRTYPFGTLVWVTYLNTGRSVVVRINDRGPLERNRVIDLSRQAAQELGVLGSGLARVQLEVIEFGMY
jgi:rare lipoprotein A